MSEWKECKLGDVGTVVTGKTPSCQCPEDFGDKVPFVTPSDYKTYRKRVSHAERKLSAAGVSKLKNKLLPPESVMVTCIGSDMGKVAINKIPVVTNQQINSIIPNSKVVNSDFLYYALVDSYPVLRSYGLAGTAVPIVNKNDFEGISILIPSLQEQDAIASVLSSLDDKIDLLHRQNRTLEALAEALFRKRFVEGADPAWEKGTLGDIAEINPQRNLKKGELAPYLDMQNMPTEGSFPKDWVMREYNGGMKFKNGDTLLARITPCLENGKTAYVNFFDENVVGYGSTEYIVLSSKRPEIPSTYFYILARSNDFRDYAIQNMTGTSGRQRVSAESISSYEIRIPPAGLLKEFEKVAAANFEKIKQNSFQIRTLSRLRDTLLPKLMSGEVRVRS
jgi:type I restriction enzyme S subunit